MKRPRGKGDKVDMVPEVDRGIAYSWPNLTGTCTRRPWRIERGSKHFKYSLQMEQPAAVR